MKVTGLYWIFYGVDLNMGGSLYMWCYMMWKNWCDENAMWKWIYATRSYQLLFVGFRPSRRWMDTICLFHEWGKMMQYLLPLCFVWWTLWVWWSIRVVLINEDVVGFLNVVWKSNDGDLVNTCKPCKNALAHVKKVHTWVF